MDIGFAQLWEEPSLQLQECLLTANMAVVQKSVAYASCEVDTLYISSKFKLNTGL